MNRILKVILDYKQEISSHLPKEVSVVSPFPFLQDLSDALQGSFSQHPGFVFVTKHFHNIFMRSLDRNEADQLSARSHHGRGDLVYAEVQMLTSGQAYFETDSARFFGSVTITLIYTSELSILTKIACRST
jgi:hypothetical protein